MFTWTRYETQLYHSWHWRSPKKIVSRSLPTHHTHKRMYGRIQSYNPWLVPDGSRLSLHPYEQREKHFNPFVCKRQKSVQFAVPPVFSHSTVENIPETTLSRLPFSTSKITILKKKSIKQLLFEKAILFLATSFLKKNIRISDLYQKRNIHIKFIKKSGSLLLNYVSEIFFF